ncbi:DUF2087 domain-containing protein [Myxococcus sp. SDU36]|uniref:DUF2087 domain-containing protein n=1 Tax=Myxococcus sp. SDU36 TaxID=2831967 RepID=UPI002543C8CB|nr:DUF2087 domain-containing protein [Myxococcus sp. SDU36]WIG96277.1 DUF2087 domain-containing protein [Myxococcus sp. SDU36]
MSVLLRSLADATRLRMIAALIEAPRTLSELTSLLSIDIESAAHQLRKLESAGLLVATTDSKVRFLADLGRLQRVAIQLSPPKRVRGAATAAEVDSETRGVLSAFFDGPRLNALPVQRRKRELVLEELLRRIPAQEEYREAALNQMIGAMFDDFCSVRREWVMAGYMTRDGGVYRLAARGRAVLSA